MWSFFHRVRVTAWGSVPAVLFLLTAGQAFGDVVHEGKWKVSTADTGVILYANNMGAAQKVMLTVCITSGGAANAQLSLPGGGTQGVVLLVPNCVTLTSNVPNYGFAAVQLQSGTSASGTYSITVSP